MIPKSSIQIDFFLKYNVDSSPDYSCKKKEKCLE